MKIKVNPKNYTSWDYPHYLNRGGDEIPKPKDAVYEVGDVIVTNEDGLGKLRLGVVLGCIGTDELRADNCGMITFDRIRHANFSDFHKSWIPNYDKLNKECHGYKIVVDYDKFTFKATEPKETLSEENKAPKVKKVDGHIISENSPKFGDRMICVQKNNVNYKKIYAPTKQQIELGIIDTKNWKVIVE